MKILETNIKNSFLIETEKINDDRGFFTRVWDKEIFEKLSMITNVEQCSISFNHKKGTLRGMHMQKYPYEEVKWVTCVKGKIYDVILDLRPESPSYKKWEKFILSSNDLNVLYIPPGVAHGFQTLEDNTSVFYQINQKYVPESSFGVMYDDSKFNIKWPLDISEISLKDKSYKSYELNHD